MATLRGQPVDRPAVSFYEVGGFDVDRDDADPFNVYNDPSWRPLLELAEEHTDLIRMRHPRLTPAPDNCRDELFATETWMHDGSRFCRTTLTVAGRTLTSLARRDPDMHTVWEPEHLLKDPDDLEAYLQLPDEVFAYEPDVASLPAAEQEVGDRGIVMVDTGDPICHAAPLFSMEDFTVVALTEPPRFHRLLEKLAPPLWQRTERIAAAFPGRLWRICGAEYATEPYLPPRLFEDYVVRYTRPMIESIHRHGGFARLHCHGRIRSALPYIVAMGADATDPIEPPPLGDVELADVRRQYGRQLALFGNLEIRDIESLPPAEFEKVVAKSLRDGTAGEGRGFVLMPSACPCGRKITAQTMANYQTMVRLATGLSIS
jgi:hypothetical protein